MTAGRPPSTTISTSRPSRRSSSATASALRVTSLWSKDEAETLGMRTSSSRSARTCGMRSATRSRICWIWSGVRASSVTCRPYPRGGDKGPVPPDGLSDRMGRFVEMADNTFVAGQGPWLERLGNLRNIVRQELVARQLAAHLPRGPLRVLDVGAGQGTQALRLARLGHSVTAVEPDGRMRATFEQAAAGLTPGQRDHVTLVATDLAGLASVTRPTAYDLVMCHGVLMYLPESRTAVAGLARRGGPGGIVSIAPRNGDAMAWRPARRHDWPAALTMLDEERRAAEQGRDA